MSYLNVTNVSHSFGGRQILENVSFKLMRGEHVGLVGANGEGKSTFLNIVTGHTLPDEGRVEWPGKVTVGYLDQQSTLQKGMTIREVLRTADVQNGSGNAGALRKNGRRHAGRNG